VGAEFGVKIIPETGGGDSSPPPECWCGCVGCGCDGCEATDRVVEELLWLVACAGVMMIPETGRSPPVVLQCRCKNTSFTHTHAHGHGHGHTHTHTHESSDRSTYHPASGG